MADTLQDVLRDYRKLPSRDRRAVEKHLTGDERLRLRSLRTKKPAKPLAPEKKPAGAKAALRDLSPWLAKRLSEAVDQDGAPAPGPLTPAASRVVADLLAERQKARGEASSKGSISAILDRVSDIVIGPKP